MEISSVLTSVSRWLDHHAKYLSKLVVAYSGGRDSHVLLAALHELKKMDAIWDLRVIHIHHGLHSQADKWAFHCEQVCQTLAIPFKVIFLGLKPQKGESVEALARKQRYLALGQDVQENELLLTAHSLDDQAETCLLQLLRGTGPLGLGGIAAFKPFKKGYLGRPLLAVEREDIAAFARSRQLVWVEDESNQDPRFRRNFLRQFIFPQLKKITPGVNACIARSGEHCYQSQLLLDEFLEEELKHCLGKSPHILNLTSFKKLSPLKRPHILRHWLRLNHIPAPSTKKLSELLNQVLTAKEDAQPCMSWEGAYLRRYQDALYSLSRPLTRLPWEPLLWDFKTPLHLPDGSIWRATLKKGQGFSQTKMTLPLQIAFRQGGERCRPAGYSGSRPLKKVLQERRIPTWQRERLPLFYAGQELIGVGGLFICEGWQNTHLQEQGWVIEQTS